jgi:hypothetical protein
VSAKILASILSLVLGIAPPSESTAQPEAGLSEAAWGGLLDKRVRVETLGGTQAGTLSTQSSTTIVLILDDGSVLELDKSVVTSVKIEPAAPAPAGVPADAPLVPAPAVAGCFDDNQCGHPRTCIEGQCVVSAAYVDALAQEGKARMTGGKWTMVTGAVILPVGLIMFGVGFGTDDFRQYGAEPLELTSYGVMAAGGIVLLAGGIAYAVGKEKLERVERYRPTAVVGRDGFTVGLRTEF